MLQEESLKVEAFDQELKKILYVTENKCKKLTTLVTTMKEKTECIDIEVSTVSNKMITLLKENVELNDNVGYIQSASSLPRIPIRLEIRQYIA